MSVGSQQVSEPTWFKSSYSGGNTTECLEAAFVEAGVFIRDSKWPQHRHLEISPTAWESFLRAPCVDERC
jgi:hypothetical protein